jgi:rSAM/selenodomain-associated transferase 2
MSKIRSHNIDIVRISIIIPTLNEAGNIKQALASTQPSTNIEVIVVDGGSKDSTVEIAKSLGVKVISTAGGRAVQMNTGALAASGEILLFLHADTRLPSGFDVMIRTALQQTGTVAGAFALRIDASQWGLRLVEWGVNWRSRFCQMPYGDQAIFLTKDLFHKIGAFPELPIMEDFELIRSLKRNGKITIINVPVITSARRWLQMGVCQTTLINQIIIIAYLLGVSPQRIVNWYRREKMRKI